MRVLFWGTPEFAVPSLRALDDEGFDVVGVVTQPDRPSGRGRKPAPSVVKEVAIRHSIPVLTPERPRGDEFMAQIRALEPDISVVVAYGHILRREVLDVPRLGSVNIHASLLPRLRGAAPIHWAIARGDEETGVTIMRMVEAMDAGPILLQVREPIFEDETGSELSMRLSELGAEALVEALALLAAGEVEEVEQDPQGVTFAPKVDREAARIDWSRPPREVALLARAMDEVPGAWSTKEGQPVKLFRPGRPVEPAPQGLADGPPGTVVALDAEFGVVVAAGTGLVGFGEVQPPGKRRMAAADWIHGRGVQVGQRFE